METKERLDALVSRFIEQHKSELQGQMDIRSIARYFYSAGFEDGVNIRNNIFSNMETKELIKNIVYMEEIVRAIKQKTHKATGEEHELYENLAFDSSSSYGYGVRVTMYALSQVLGEDVVMEAMKKWLKS